MTIAGPLVWAVHDGRVGIANQVLGLAEASGLAFRTLCFRPGLPWRWLPPALWRAPAGSRALSPPWPDLMITCGGTCAAAALAVKRASHGRTFLAQIQDPRFGRRRFDLLIVPEHDPARGTNVVATRGAVHRVTPAILAAAGERMAPALAHLPHPRIAVLIGGNNRVYRLGEAELVRLADQLAAMAHRHGASLLVTPSRRTGEAGERLLREGLAGVPAMIWDGDGDNPYFAFLALADAIVVTADSISMVSEAASTGKPVQVVELPGGSAKFRAFHAAMRAAGVTRPFEGALQSWTYPPLNDTALAAAELRRRFAARRTAAA